MSKTIALAAAAAFGLSGTAASAIEPINHAPKPEYVIEEVDWAVLADEPSQHLALAKENITRKDFQAAAANIRKAAEHLKIAAHTASKESQAALASSEKELKALADEVTREGENATAKFDAIAARSARVLAKDHVQKARQSMVERKPAATGHYLGAAAREVEQGARWTGREMEKGTVAAIDGVRALCGKLTEGTGYLTDETGKGISFVGAEVEKLGEKTMPHHAARQEGIQGSSSAKAQAGHVTKVVAREPAKTKASRVTETAASQQSKSEPTRK